MTLYFPFGISKVIYLSIYLSEQVVSLYTAAFHDQQLEAVAEHSISELLSTWLTSRL